MGYPRIFNMMNLKTLVILYKLINIFQQSQSYYIINNDYFKFQICLYQNTIKTPF